MSDTAASNETTGTGISHVPDIPKELENWRGETIGRDGVRRLTRARRDPVKPVPEGTYVAMVFRVTGYDADCDGSLMARLESQYNAGAYDGRVNDDGQYVPTPTVRWEGDGWEPTHIGLSPGSAWVVADPGVLNRLAGPATVTPTLAPDLANDWTRSDGKSAR